MEFSINDRPERVVEQIYYEKPELVAFSCYIWNMQYVEQLATLIKRIDSSIKILYGGPEVSYDSETALRNSTADFVIEGEGEEPYREFIEHLVSGKTLDNIRSLYYKHGSKIIYGGKRVLMDIRVLRAIPAYKPCEGILETLFW